VVRSISATKKSKRGRPATGKGEPVQVRLQPSQIAAVDAWIEAQGDPKPSRPEAIRRLIDEGLAGSKKKGARAMLSEHARKVKGALQVHGYTPADGLALDHLSSSYLPNIPRPLLIKAVRELEERGGVRMLTDPSGQPSSVIPTPRLRELS
jgi:hypothetical protein